MAHKRKTMKGQGMVEFALVFPLLLMLTVGIIEFGWMLFSYSAVVSSSREGARYGAAIQDVGGGIPQFKDCQGIKKAAKRIGGLVGVEDDDITIQYSNDSGIYALSCPPSQEVKLSDQIIVTVQKDIQPIVPLIEIPPIPVHSSASRTILKNVEIGESGTGAGSISGAVTDVNFKTTSQTAEETKGTISVDLILNQTATDNVTVPFSITGTATEGSDYTITSSPAIIPAGSQSTTIYITLINDEVGESDETLVLGLGTPTNATKGPQDIHTVTIVDPPDVSFSLASQSRSEGISEVAIQVELSKGSSQDITVPFTKSGDAEWGSTKDYTTNTTSVFFPSGTLTKTVFLYINDDLIDEYDETAILTLGTPTNALLGNPKSHTLTILDNDDPPEVSFFTSTLSISEEVGTLITHVGLSNISGKEITIPYSLSGSTTSSDYVVMSPSPITIPAGNAEAGIYFSISEGDGMEEDETLIIDLGSPTNGTLGAITTQTVIITEETALPEISFATSSSSGQEDSGTQKIYVEMSNGWTENVTVNYSVSGTADRGSSGDYTLSPQPLVIPKGAVRKEIDVELVDDIVDEDEETIIITLDSVSAGALGTLTTHTHTIYDEDSQPEVSFEQTSQTKMETGGNVSIHISMNAPSSKDVSVPLTYSGTATSGEDYEAPVTEVLIPAGMTEATINLELIDDSEYDPDETVLVAMGSPTNGTLGGITEHEITIDDDELPPCKVESNLLSVGTTNITWNLVNEGEDVTFLGGTVTWPASANEKPRLQTIYFGGSEIYSGNDKPGTISYATSDSFSSGAFVDLTVMFSEELGSGDHTLVATFENQLSGDICSATISYNKP